MAGSKSKLLLAGLAYLGFVSLGLPDGLLGVAWPSIRATFGLPIDALGALLVTYTAGYLASSFGSGRLLRRMGVGTLLAWSCAATGASLLGYAAAPWWAAVVALGLLAGLGAGAIDAGLNTYAATHFSPRVVNWLHAFYGVGATAGPALMTWVLMAGRPWRHGYAAVGLWQILLAAAFGLTSNWWSEAGAAGEEGATPSAPHSPGLGTIRLPAAQASVAVFFVYTGIEATAGAWAYSLFTEGRGVAASAAGAWVSVYFGALTAGRFLSGFAAGFAPVHLLLRASLLGVLLGAALVWLDLADALSFAGLALLGLSLAPVFPSLIATTPERLGGAHTANAVGFQIAAAVLGQSLVPAAVGLLAGRLGLEAVAASLPACALLLLTLYELLALLSRKIHHRGAETQSGI